MDNTLIMGDENWINIKVMKSILFIFKLMLGMKVDIYTSLSMGVNVVISWLEETSNVFLCIFCKIGRKIYHLNVMHF